MTKHIVLLFSLSTVLAHEYYRGSCPVFPPMRDLDWTRLTGDWWTAFKMNSRSSCIRYRYSSENGERKVTERKLLPVLGRFGVPSGVTSSGVITGAFNKRSSFSQNCLIQGAAATWRLSGTLE